MHSNSRLGNQEGFSLIEMTIAMVVMLIVTSAIASLVKSSMSIATATYEVTDAQESLRTAQEFINRDLMSAGDGLKNMANIPVTKIFVTNYLTINPIADPALPNTVTNLGILTTDNDVPANKIVYGPDPAVATNPLVYVRSSPVLTDRQTILQIDSDFSPIGLLASAINASGSTITIADADRTRFTAGEIYFLTSSAGGTFGTVTSVTDIAGPNSTLTFAQGALNGDTFGLNVTGAGGRINTISGGGTLPTSLQRMRIIHYYVNSNGMLMRRVFGVKGAGFRENAIAEHVISVQFVYSLGPDDNGNIVQPVTRLTTLDQQIAVRQVEVTVTVETPHAALQNGLRPNMSMTTSTSVRNMQFRQALQPKATV
ncbi:MAG: prepilin-type N-terminal cleavage/methylation domain-containing protein [Acidobacteriota bacterium]|nr:prepilin-type N-terminal cleavage/methylation domain-containing protein [Acidobacteriota bacterium]